MLIRCMVKDGDDGLGKVELLLLLVKRDCGHHQLTHGVNVQRVLNRSTLPAASS